MIKAGGAVFLCAGAIAGMTTIGVPGALAAWPEKPIRIIVPTGPSGGADLQARVLAEIFRTETGQPFVIDNRPGAGTLIGTELAVQAPPNGYTALFTTANVAVTSAFLGGKMKFSVTRDLAPVSWVTSTPLVLAVHASVPAKSVKDLIALAKKRPGVFNFGINIPGSTSNLAAEMLKQFAGIDATIVPFKSGAYAMTSLVSGEIDLLFAAGSVVKLHLPSGRIRALAVTTRQKSSAFPGLPTMDSLFAGFVADNWYAMFFPANTPRDIVDRMNRLIADALKSDRMREYMKSDALDPVGSSSEALAKMLAGEIAKYSAVIRKGNIRMP